MVARIATLFVVVSFAELAILIMLGKAIDLLPTLAIIVVTGIVGATLAKRQGERTLQQIQSQLNRGALPGNELLEGVLILLSGAFLLTPGLITDTAGMLLLVPPVRRLVRDAVKKEMVKRIEPPSAQSFSFYEVSRSPYDDGEIIDIQPVETEGEEPASPRADESRMLH